MSLITNDAIMQHFGYPGAVNDKVRAFFNALYTGSGSPEGVTTAATGSFYLDTTNGALYAKQSGSGNTGWIAGVAPGSGSGPYAPAGTTGIKREHVFADSYGEGYSPTAADQFPYGNFWRYSARVARYLGAIEVNHAVSGSQVNLPISPLYRGFHARTLTRHNPGSHISADSELQYVIVHIGANDAGDANNYTDTLLFKRFLEAGIRRLRYGAIFETEPSGLWVLAQGTGGTNWSTPGTNLNGLTSSAASRIPTAVGNTFTIAIPATFNGGSWVLHGMVTQGNGGVFAVTADGASVGSWDSRLSGMVAAVSYPTWFEIPNLAAGAHTIIGTYTTHAGNWNVDYAGVEATHPPLIHVLGNMDAPTLPTGPGTHSPITSADRARFNQDKQDVCALFTDGLVRYLLPTLDTSNALLWASDSQHPSPDGHELIADQIITDIVASGYLSSFRKSRAFDPTVVQKLRVLDPPDDSTQGSATLVAGTVTVSTRAVTSKSKVFIQRTAGGGTLGADIIPVITGTVASTAGTIVFTAKKTDGTTETADTSTFNWWLLDTVVP